MADWTRSSSAADRNLLFGILALQMDFISRDQLVAAMNAWVLDKAKPLGQVLVEQGALSSSRRGLLDPLVDEHVAQHGGDPERSLAALSSVSDIRPVLAPIGDADVRASLNLLQARGQSESSDTLPQKERPTPVTGLRFRILRPHARGGLGEVFVAEDGELHREVALKEIQNQHADQPASRDRFLLEAEITGGLEHPGIVPVYSLGCYADGRPFYAMRFIKGDSLAEAIERFHAAESPKQNTGERLVALRGLLRRFLDVCNAIAYAHSRGVLHRDLKPSNIMLGKYGETLVVDWGLAKATGNTTPPNDQPEQPLQPYSDGGSTPTLVGSAIGTAAYMSPEQAAGRLNQLGPASDVYSLGATLYHLLTNKTPFEGNDVGDILRRVQQENPLPPNRVKSGVPTALSSVCLKAMSLSPQDRYSSAIEMASDIECWLADEAVSAHKESIWQKVTRWSRHHQELAAFFGIAGVCDFILLVIFLGREVFRSDRFLGPLLAQLLNLVLAMQVGIVLGLMIGVFCGLVRGISLGTISTSVIMGMRLGAKTGAAIMALIGPVLIVAFLLFVHDGRGIPIAICLVLVIAPTLGGILGLAVSPPQSRGVRALVYGGMAGGILEIIFASFVASA
jgi:serine/threonine protein kinase